MLANIEWKEQSMCNEDVYAEMDAWITKKG